MLGVTAHVSTDVAAIPLLWVVPLAIYLATFVLAFARTTRRRPRRITQWAVAVAFAVAVVVGRRQAAAGRGHDRAQLVMLALVAYAAHARLAAERPRPEQLTAYYLVVATGAPSAGCSTGWWRRWSSTGWWSTRSSLVAGAAAAGRGRRAGRTGGAARGAPRGPGVLVLAAGCMSCSARVAARCALLAGCSC